MPTRKNGRATGRPAKPLPGASPERQEEFEDLKSEFEEEGRYPGREAEVAARIVNKQRRQFGETKEQQKAKKAGDAEDKRLPIRGYQGLTIPEVLSRAKRLTREQLAEVLKFERGHRKRKTLVTQLTKMRTDAK